MAKETIAQIQFVSTRENVARPQVPVITYKSVPAKKQWSLIATTLLLSGMMLFAINPALFSAGSMLMLTGVLMVMIRFFYMLFTIDFDISSLDLTDDEIMKELDW